MQCVERGTTSVGAQKNGGAVFCAAVRITRIDLRH
jgi:hypothetical protein